MESQAGNSSKLVCHGTLPLAFAIGGMGEFTINGKETIIAQLIRDQFPAWGQMGRINFRAFEDWAKAVLLPPLLEARAADPEASNQSVTLTIGFCNGGKAESGMFRIDHEVRFLDKSYNKTVMPHPQTLKVWFSQQSKNKFIDFIGKKKAKSGPLANHAKKTVEDAIKAEKTLVKDGLCHCGGHAEVMIADSNGARFVCQAPIGSL